MKKYIGKKFGSYHRSRELAVQFLCSLDIYPEQEISESLELFWGSDVFQDDKPEVKERSRQLVTEVLERKSEIDAILLKTVTNWRPERMSSVDRTVLRLMILEGFLLKDLPVRSAMSEASVLANDFGSRESSRFVKGVLYKVSKNFEVEEE